MNVSDGNPPADSVKIQDVYLAISATAFATIITLTVIGIVIAIAFLVFNTVYRNRR